MQFVLSKYVGTYLWSKTPTVAVVVWDVYISEVDLLTGLPDGIFPKPKILIWANFGWYWNEKGCYLYYIAIWNVCISAIWNILWAFGNLVAIWYIFPRFGILCQVNLATVVTK
jgi:hypothetical protein